MNYSVTVLNELTNGSILRKVNNTNPSKIMLNKSY